MLQWKYVFERELFFMHAALCLGFGYLIGCISPSAWVAKKKNVNLKQEGTGNLGATNTTLVLGRGAGLFVLFFDILKSYFAAKTAKLLFPHLAVAGMIAGIGAILGHCFPVFMHFSGGKGLAAFGGLILYYNPWFFLGIIITGILLMTLLNRGVAAPIMGCIVFPILVWLHSHDPADTSLALAASALIFGLHWTNLMKSIHGEDVISTKNFYKDILFRKKN